MDNDIDSRDVKFIQMVQENPFLYGKRSGFEYDKSVKRSQIWQNIAQEMNFTVDQAVKKWRYLRDKYVKEKRKLKCNFDDGNDDSNPLADARIWPLYNYLTFLSKHVRNRCNGKNLSIDTQRDMEFISLVQKHPILYNKSSVSYNNTKKRAAIWREIAFTMNYSEGDEAHKKWRYLRDKYVKYKRMLSINDPTIMNEEFEEWPLYKCLSFLSQHVRKRRTLNEYITDDSKTELKVYDSFFDDLDDDMSSNNCDNDDDKHNLNKGELSNIIPDNDDKEEYVIEHLGDDEELELSTHTETADHQYDMPIDKVDIVTEYDPFIEYEIEEVLQEQELDENTIEEPLQQQQDEVKASIIHQKLSPTIVQSDNKSSSSLSGSADEAFCNYVAYEMKEMTKQNKNLLKRMITNFINEKNTEQ